MVVELSRINVNWLNQKELDINEVLEEHSKQLRTLRGKVDLVAGGPPCQGFSTAGKRIENDHRNELIHSYVKFIRAVQPKVIFFEIAGTPFVLILLVASAAFFTIYFGFPNIRYFKTAINVVRGKYDEIEHATVNPELAVDGDIKDTLG